MSLFRKVVMFENQNGSGYFLVEIVRLPFRLFSRKPYRFHFRPNFEGAKFHEIDTQVVDIETLLDAENAFAAMAYLRSLAP